MPKSVSATNFFRIINLAIALALVSLMIRTIWLRDLTFGDTSSYFRSAVAWAERGVTNILWSPVYTIFYGSVWQVVQDANAATWWHRVILIVASDVLVAWIALKALPRPLCYFFVLWWAVLPIHFNTLYEVHLFGALPFLVMILIPFVSPNRWIFPAWIGIASATTLLVRNEYVVLLGVLGIYVLFQFYWRLRAKQPVLSASDAVPYVVALSLCAALVALVYSWSDATMKEMVTPARSKHTLNMCQVYAFGHQQRHPEWQGSPWTECEPLMEETFGIHDVTLSQMILANPTAVLQHFAWNFLLAPAGFELLLFNATGGGPNPDYVPPPTIRFVPHLLLTAFVGLGIFWTYRIARFGATNKSSAKYICVLMPLLVGSTLMIGLIIATQRPRPSYMLGYGVLLVLTWLLLGSAASGRLRSLREWWLSLILGVFAWIVLPSYNLYAPSLQNGFLGALYDQTKPRAAAICRPSGKIGIGSYAFEIMSYLCNPQLESSTDQDRHGPRDVTNLYGLDKASFADSGSFVAKLEASGVETAVVDVYLVDIYPQLGDCEKLRSAFKAAAWYELSYSKIANGRCIAVFDRSVDGTLKG